MGDLVLPLVQPRGTVEAPGPVRGTLRQAPLGGTVEGDTVQVTGPAMKGVMATVHLCRSSNQVITVVETGFLETRVPQGK